MNIGHVTRTYFQLLLLLLTLFASSGCTNNRIPRDLDQALDAPDSFTLISIDPTHPSTLEAAQKSSGSLFHGYRILGATDVTDASARRDLNQALRRSVRENSGDFRAMCFNPRHAIRLTHLGSRYEVLICFECLAAIVWTDGKESGKFGPSGSGQARFDQILRQADVPLASD